MVFFVLWCIDQKDSNVCVRVHVCVRVFKLRLIELVVHISLAHTVDHGEGCVTQPLVVVMVMC